MACSRLTFWRERSRVADSPQAPLVSVPASHPLDLDQLYHTHLQSYADESFLGSKPRLWSAFFRHVVFLYRHTQGPLRVSSEPQEVIFSNPAASTFSVALEKLYSSFFRVPPSALQRPAISIADTASMAPLTVDERHRIWLRLCHIASSALPTV